MWMYLGLLAALFLGLHNLFKKHAVQGNEVFPVLLGTVSSGFLFVAAFYLLFIFYPEYAKENGYNFQDIAWKMHGFIFIKSAIMAASWILAYQALKHIQITIVKPIRSAGPFFRFI
jgi:uncharacterized membrane protein